jgi:hypothetical protein
MSKRFLSGSCLILLAFGLLFLAFIGFALPGDLLLNLAFGWMFYLYRVIPQVVVSESGVLTAAFCLGALAVGLHWFLRWFAVQSGSRSWPPRRTGVLLALIVLMFVAGIAVVGIGHQTAWLLTSPEPIVKGDREPSSRAQSQNNLKWMALAMQNYQDTIEEKTFPPAALYDQRGHALLSWRVLILPYLEEQSLYNEFHLDEPWDSPHNLPLLSRMPRVYKSPYRGDKDAPYHTHYRVFVGDGAAFEGRRGLRVPEDFPDGTSNTLLIVEATEAVPWTQPAELSFDRNRPSSLQGWRNPHSFLAALADGSVRGIDRTVSETTLRAAITRNGGEKLGADW